MSGLTSSGSTWRWRRLRELILIRDGHRCRYCSASATHVDHVLARALGGPDAPSNLVAACRTCNLSKGSKGFGGLVRNAIEATDTPRLSLPSPLQKHPKRRFDPPMAGGGRATGDDALD